MSLGAIVYTCDMKKTKAKPAEFMAYAVAAEYLGIEEKLLKNYEATGGELSRVIPPSKKRLAFAKTELDRWKTNFDSCCVALDMEDYLKCLEFAVSSYYGANSRSDFGAPQQRDIGKFIDNYTSGKMGEIAIKKFLEARYGCSIKLDFGVHPSEVSGQDIVEVVTKSGTKLITNPPRIRVAIKTSKMKNVWLVVSKTEVERSVRASDVYVFVRVDLPPDHLFRLVRTHPSLSNLKDMIPELDHVIGQVVGYATYEDLRSETVSEVLPGSEQKIMPSYILRTGRLRTDWKSFVGWL